MHLICLSSTLSQLTSSYSFGPFQRPVIGRSAAMRGKWQQFPPSLHDFLRLKLVLFRRISFVPWHEPPQIITAPLCTYSVPVQTRMGDTRFDYNPTRYHKILTGRTFSNMTFMTDLSVQQLFGALPHLVYVARMFHLPVLFPFQEGDIFQVAMIGWLDMRAHVCMDMLWEQQAADILPL